METNVWQLFAKGVALALSRFASSSEAQNMPSGGESPSAPESDADSTLISKNATILAVTRDPKKETTDALFGDMAYEGTWLCYSLERKAVAIPLGTYRGYKRWSDANKTTVIGIDVPGRSDIEVHSADWAKQLKGCIATGEADDSEEAFADSNNKRAFQKVMATVPDEFTVVIASL